MHFTRDSFGMPEFDESDEIWLERVLGVQDPRWVASTIEDHAKRTAEIEAHLRAARPLREFILADIMSPKACRERGQNDESPY